MRFGQGLEERENHSSRYREEDERQRVSFTTEDYDEIRSNIRLL